MTELYSRFSEEVAFPRGLIIWNYFDHEHVVGTHFEHYHQIRILAEENNWCFSQRSATLPFITIKIWATQFSYLKSDKWMRSFHFGPFALLLEQDFHFEHVERRLNVWQLGFRDFVGLNYVNNKTVGPDRPDVERPYPIELPVPKITEITRGGVSRPFRRSRKLGYGLPELPE